MDNRNTWPWLAGQAELVDRIADRHHQAKIARDELPEWTAILGAKSSPDGPTWRELLDAGYRALEVTGREIAAAKDQDSAAAARLKLEVYESRLEAMIGALLGIAHRTLQTHPDDFGWLVGYGCRIPGGALEIIKPADWAVGAPDWERRRLDIEGQTAFYDIRLLDLQVADREVFDTVLADLAYEQTPDPKKTVAAETACREWLTERFRSPRNCLKTVLRGEADQKFSGLSDRSFERAWTAAKAAGTTDPTWRKSGPLASS